MLVHGAFSDASAWNGVCAKLQGEGFVTLAPAMPQRRLHSDAAYLAAFLDTIESPVVLAGQSYGGFVISHPIIAERNVRSLVFVAAFAPDEGESASDLNLRWPGSKLGEGTTMIRPYPGGKDLYLRPECFRDVYAGDLALAAIAPMAAAQRPIDTTALRESFDARPSWQKFSSSAVISTRDNCLPAAAQRFMAQRANALITEIDTSHALPLSQPELVAAVIVAAARAGSEN